MAERYDRRSLLVTSNLVFGERDRLQEIFPGVAQPGVLRNSAKCPLYLLCFAAANKNGARPALKIANDLLRKVH